MAVPEASVDEDNDVNPRKYKIRLAKERPTAPPARDIMAPEDRDKAQLRGFIASRFYARHDRRAAQPSTAMVCFFGNEAVRVHFFRFLSRKISSHCEKGANFGVCVPRLHS